VWCEKINWGGGVKIWGAMGPTHVPEYTIKEVPTTKIPSEAIVWLMASSTTARGTFSPKKTTVGF
jgi:hypothetical protein